MKNDLPTKEDTVKDLRKTLVPRKIVTSIPQLFDFVDRPLIQREVIELIEAMPGITLEQAIHFVEFNLGRAGKLDAE